MSYVGDFIVNLVIIFLFIIGGIGFIVLFDIMKNWWFKVFFLYMKIMLIGILILNVVVMFVIFILEYSNFGMFGYLYIGDKLWVFYF